MTTNATVALKNMKKPAVGEQDATASQHSLQNVQTFQPGFFFHGHGL